jgi:hypothetical protein
MRNGGTRNRAPAQMHHRMVDFVHPLETTCPFIFNNLSRIKIGTLIA